jgi:TetR/AcrR family transcriptional regulator, cholesterol catabolism regulator
VTSIATGDRRARRKQETRERIVDAAVELFVRQGYDATTVDQIAAAADVARGTFFNHFPGKEDVPHAAIERRRKELRDVIAATTAPDATTRILDGLKNLAALYDADSATRRPMLRIWIRCGGPFGPGHGQTADFIRAFLDEGKSAGDVRKDLDTSMAGLVLQDVYIGALCRWAASETDSLQQHLQPALELVMPLLH